MKKKIRIGTRDSKLAVWQAGKVAALLTQNGWECELVTVKSEGDLDLVTPLYAMGVQGVFTKTLDAYLLSDKVDVVVHSMKDVPIQLAQGIVQAAVLKRASYKDLLVYKNKESIQRFFTSNADEQTSVEGVIATGSVRRKAALLHRFPRLHIENLRGIVQTRMKKLQENNWDAAVFAAAGLERIEERPENAIEVDWMLPAPAQGAIMVVCKHHDNEMIEACKSLNDKDTAACVHIEREFLKGLMGGCSTPISALAQIEEELLIFKGNIYSLDGKQKYEIEKTVKTSEAEGLGERCALELLDEGAKTIVEQIRNTDK